MLKLWNMLFCFGFFLWGVGGGALFCEGRGHLLKNFYWLQFTANYNKLNDGKNTSFLQQYSYATQKIPSIQKKNIYV